MDNRTDIRARIPADLKQAFDDAAERMGITQQQAVERLAGWFVAQDELVQLVILGVLNVKGDDELSTLIARRLSQRPDYEQTVRRPKKKGRRTGT